MLNWVTNNNVCGHCRKPFAPSEPVKELFREKELVAVVCRSCFPSKVGVPLEIMEFIREHKTAGDIQCPCCPDCDPMQVVFLDVPEPGTLGPATLRCPNTGRVWTEEKLYNPNDLVEMAAFWYRASGGILS